MPYPASQQYVRAWIENLPAFNPVADPDPDHDHDLDLDLDSRSWQPSHDAKRSKRRRSTSPSPCLPSKRRHLPTPAASAGMSQSPTKRSYDDDAESSSVTSSYLDNDRTPRSKKTKLLPPWGIPLTAVSSRRSGSSSPRKQTRSTVTNAISRQYSSKEAPESLRAMWKAIDRYDKGIGIIGHSEKDAVEAAQKRIPEYEQDVFESFFYEDGPGARTALGPTPSIAAVLDIIERGMCCRNEQMDEADWNQIVHGRILELALASLWQNTQDLVAAIPCTSAGIISEYADAGGRKIDFCACIRPDALAATAITTIRDQDPLAKLSINHTDFPPLRGRPIALSIETKIHGEGLSSAETQLVTWHAAQWRVLNRLVTRAEQPAKLPDFLPGIIIQGHEWSFVASTKRGDQVTLWTSQHIGSTAKVTGVYQIVCVLQYLKNWIETEYWPWYKKDVLRLSET